MLTKKGKYGLKALVHLSGLPVGQLAFVNDIAVANNIPKKFLDAILGELRNAGFVLSRKGKEFTVTGATNVRAGTEIKVATERPTLSLGLTEMDAGSWVIFELPGFTTAASGTQQSSLDALRKASDTSYFKGKDALWVKVVSNGNGARGPIGGGAGGGTSLQVSR